MNPVSTPSTVTSEASHGRPMPAKVVVVTPWYPTPDRPYYGKFVRDWTTAMASPSMEITVLHVAAVEQNVPTGYTTSKAEFGTEARLKVKVKPRMSREESARSYRRGLRQNLPVDLLRNADLVVAHVGLPTGWAILDALPAHLPLILVEHASYLPALLQRTVTRRMYGQLLNRAETVLCVGEEMAASLRGNFPAAASRIWAVGNPVDDSLFYPSTAGQGQDLKATLASRERTWLYVGNLLRTKGVAKVLESFRYSLESGESGNQPGKVVLVGSGADAGYLKELASKLHLDEEVIFAGPLNGTALLRALHEADVLVHLSEHETFGLAVLEAVLAGLPVVSSATHGARQTLGGAGSEAGVRLVDLPVNAQEVARAVNQVLQDVDPHAQAKLRESLISRFGSQAFGARLTRVLTGLTPFESTSGPTQATFRIKRISDLQAVRTQVAYSLLQQEAVRVLTPTNSWQFGWDPRVTVITLVPSRLRRLCLAALNLVGVRFPQALANALAYVCSFFERLLPSPLKRGVAYLGNIGDRFCFALRSRAQRRVDQLTAQAVRNVPLGSQDPLN